MFVIAPCLLVVQSGTTQKVNTALLSKPIVGRGVDPEHARLNRQTDQPYELKGEAPGMTLKQFKANHRHADCSNPTSRQTLCRVYEDVSFAGMQCPDVSDHQTAQDVYKPHRYEHSGVAVASFASKVANEIRPVILDH